MANKMKAIFGLMTVILLVITMVPIGVAKIDPAHTDLSTDFYMIENDDNTPVTFTIKTTENGGAVEEIDLFIGGDDDQVVPVKHYGKINDDNAKIKVQNTNGYQDVTVTLGDIKDAIQEAMNDCAPNNPVFDFPAEDILKTYDFKSVGAVANIVDEVHIVLSAAPAEDTISTAMFEQEDIIDQTGKKDELNPGDDFTVYIEIDGDEDETSVVYHGMYLEGRLYDTVTGEYYGMDETKTFTLGDESRVTKTLSFSIPRQLQLDNDKDSNRLRLDVDVFAYEQTGNIDVRGHSDWEWFLDLEANEDSLYISEATINPAEVDAGDSISVDAEICNDGVEIQEDIVVTAEILGLGVKYTSTIVELANNDCESWAVGLAIPSNAKAGDYDVRITAESDAGATATYTKTITVEGDATTPTAKTADIDVIGEDTLELGTDGKATFTFELENKGEDRQIYDIEVDGVEAELSQDKITLDAGEKAEFTVTVEEAGEFTVFAKVNGNTEAFEDGKAITGSATTVVAKDEVVKVLQWVFAVIIIIAIILVIVWAVTKGRKNEDGKSEVYY